MKYSKVVLLSAIAVNAAPSRRPHELHYVKRTDGTKLPFYYSNKTSFKTNEPTGGANFVAPSDEETIAIGKAHLQKTLGLGENELSIVSTYKSRDGVMHIYGSRLINGVVVSNHDAAVHILNGEVIAESSSFTNLGANLLPVAVSNTTPLISLDQAVELASKQYGLPRDDYPAHNAYVEIPGNKIVYAHVFQLRDDSKPEWLQVSVDAESGQVIQAISYYNQASYKVIPLPKKSPLDGFSVVVDPENAKASPKGWAYGTSTAGNNVNSKISSQTGTLGDVSFAASQPPTYTQNQKAALVNNFYVSNMVHDITYQYGFDEAGGNFQEDNFGKGGQGGDSVIINNQAAGKNNANFATPPDGQKPTMNMFIFDLTNPNRDGALENGIPIHEFGHGVSNRLTGGPSNTDCLSTTEAGGMGEGWSDMLAIILTQQGTETRNTDYAMGTYVMNNPKGIRQYPYSTNMNTNPMSYNTLASQSEVHDIGTTWATILYEVYWNLVDQYGFSSNLYDATQQKGNIMMLQLMLGGMKVQPCSPTVLNARDAIISADSTYYGGANKCLLWKAFAKRGLGVDAKQNGYVNGFNVPTSCGGSGTSTGNGGSTTPSTSTCAHDKCQTGGVLKSSCDSCVAKIIASDSYCGSSTWDQTCVDEVTSICGIQC